MSCFRRSAILRGCLALALAGGIISFLGPDRALAQNLLTNGNFDQNGGFTIRNGYAAVGSGTLITGWTTQIGNAANANVYIAQANSGATWIPNPQSGRYSVQLDSTSNDPLGTVSSSITQTVNVTAGQSYLLSYWFTTEVKANLTTILQTTLSGAYSNISSHSTTAGPTITQSTAVWVHVQQAFTATTTGALTITFADISTSDSNASIDNVSLTVVPEPAACAAGALSLGYLGMWLRRRRQMAAA